MGGGRFGEKNMIIIKKDMEKKIQKALEKAGKDLTEEQSQIVVKIVKQNIEVVERQQRQKFAESESEIHKIRDSLEKVLANFRQLQVNVDTMTSEFQKFCLEFREQQERYDVCIKKMIKDKRATV